MRTISLIFFLAAAYFAKAQDVCSTSVTASLGNNIVPATMGFEYWYNYTMPIDGKLLITSDIFFTFNAYLGSCENLITLNETDNPIFNEISLTELKQGDQIYISFNPTGESFSWDLSAAPVEPGDDCLNAVVAESGTNTIGSIPTTYSNDLYYTFTMPSDGKFQISSTSGEYVYVYSGLCGSAVYQGGGYSNLTVNSLKKGDIVIIRWDLLTNSTLFDWELSVVPFENGDLCSVPVIANTGANSVSTTNSVYWYQYTIPSDGKLKITSTAGQDFELYSGTCENLVYEGYGFDNLTVTGFKTSDIVYIVWYLWEAGSFDWNINVLPVTDGDICELPLDAIVGDNTHLNEQSVYWYSFTAPVDRYFQIDDMPPGLGLQADVYATCANMRESRIIGPNETVGIKVENFGEINSISLNWTISEIFPNQGELCQTAISPLNGINIAPPGEYEYWYKYTPDVKEKITISSVGHTTVDTYVNVYSDCDIGELGYKNLLKQSDSYLVDGVYTGQSRIDLTVNAGETIYFVWGNYEGATFNWNFESAIAGQGDDCDLAVLAEQGAISTPTTPYWYKYTALNHEKITISGNNENIQFMEVFTGCPTSEINSLGGIENPMDTEMSVYLKPTETIYINWDNMYSHAAFDWNLSSVSSTAVGPDNMWIWEGGNSAIHGLGNYGEKGIVSPENFPRARLGHFTWTDNNGNLWLFGGLGYDGSIGNDVLLNDLWKFDGTNWTWVSGSNSVNVSGVYGILGEASALNMPGGRQNGVNWVDNSGNLWLFGGYGLDVNGAEDPLNDVWKFDGTNWTWMGGGNIVNQQAIYGEKNVPNAANNPGSRWGSVSWTDGGGNLWLFGGSGKDEFGSPQRNNSLWRFDGSMWTWVSGTSGANPPGVYGNLGEAAPDNTPGGRMESVSWIGVDGGLWLFGGYGYDALNNYGFLNDLWKFDGSNWVWKGGSNSINQNGVYGTLGVADPNNIPGSRSGMTGWTDNNHNFWLFGGEIYGEMGDAVLDDLWKFDGTNWIWVNGKSTVKTDGVYLAGELSSFNKPGSRYASVGWKDANGHVWLFGGMAYDVNGEQGVMNDLWRYPLNTEPLPTFDPGVSISETQPTCGNTDGSITINTTTPGTYTYSIDNGSTWQSSNVFPSLAADTYIVIVKNDQSETSSPFSVELTAAGGTTWYADSDGDGFGDNSTTTLACSKPAGYVVDNTDCDDSDAAVNTSGTDVAGSGTDANCDGNYTWYVDADGDGFGTTTTTTSTNATPGTGEADNSDDCNDASADITTTTWYADTDSDGFGNPDVSQNACTKPDGYVADNTDCDDTLPSINTSATDTPGSGIDANCDGLYTWYEDLDGDTYGSAVTITSANATAGSGESATGDDCDDADLLINPGVTDAAGSGIDANCDGNYAWYEDLDGDGFGSSVEVTSTNATPGAGEADNNTDCNDGNASITITTWYADTDSDGYGDPGSSQQTCTQPTGYVADNTDCDDTNATVNPGITEDTAGSGIDANCDGQYTWYVDSDGDGFGTTTTITSANATSGTGEANNNTDCDDGNASITTTTWYADSDGDGYGDANTSQQACTKPVGYVADNTDCDDTKAGVNTAATDVAGSGIDANCDNTYTWYVDADGDGFGDILTTTSANATPGTGEANNNTDCDDTDGTVNAVATWYADNDGDGFGDPNTSQSSCKKTVGYVLDNTDHNDGDATQNPNATDTPGSGIDANGDGQYTWYKDADGDGFGSTTTVTSTNKTAGTGESANNTDTNDADAAQNPDATDTPGSGTDANGDGLYTWYKDADGDGHGSTTTTTSSNATSGAGESATSGDCDDADKDVYPGAPALPDGKDNNCDGTIDKATLTVTVNDASRAYGAADPAFTFTYTGFAGTDDATVINTTPTATTTATATSDVGTYPITATGAVDDVYDFTYVDGTLTITQAAATITLTDLDQQGDGTPKMPTVTTDPPGLNYTITYDGATTAPSNPGTYAVVATIAETNYTGEATGALTISEVLGLSELQRAGMQFYPNPVRDYLTLSWKETKARRLALYDATGRLAYNVHVREDGHRIDMRGLAPGLYRLVVTEDDGQGVSVNIIRGR